MSHLKCTRHERRVIVSDGKAIHRSTRSGETNPSCDTKGVLSGAAAYSVNSPHFTSKSFPEVK